jgi:hypothetical protein
MVRGINQAVDVTRFPCAWRYARKLVNRTCMHINTADVYTVHASQARNSWYRLVWLYDDSMFMFVYVWVAYKHH